MLLANDVRLEKRSRECRIAYFPLTYAIRGSSSSAVETDDKMELLRVTVPSLILCATAPIVTEGAERKTKMDSENGF